MDYNKYLQKFAQPYSSDYVFEAPESSKPAAQSQPTTQSQPLQVKKEPWVKWYNLTLRKPAPDVKAVQQFLHANKVDGIYGPETYSLITKWQKENGFTPDGDPTACYKQMLSKQDVSQKATEQAYNSPMGKQMTDVTKPFHTGFPIGSTQSSGIGQAAGKEKPVPGPMEKQLKDVTKHNDWTTKSTGIGQDAGKESYVTGPSEKRSSKYHALVSLSEKLLKISK